MRLNRFLALAGVASRRGSEELVRGGRVRVNGAACTELAAQISSTDLVQVDGRKVQAQAYVYLLLNKPCDYLTTRDDERSRKTIYDLLPPGLPRLAHVGRLDKESEGMLLLTNDGALALRLSHPRYKLPKEYLVTLDRPFDAQDAPKLHKGIYLAEGRARFDSAEILPGTQIRVILTQGIKREVRRVFAALDYKVRRLQRVRIGELTLQGLRAGQVRHLTPAEVAALQGKPTGSANKPKPRAVSRPR